MFEIVKWKTVFYTPSPVCIMQIFMSIDTLHSSVADVLHSTNPQHLIFRFDRFIYAISFGKITAQPTACQKRCIGCLFMLFEISFAPLSPNSNSSFFLGW